jgi:hypothetical protein
MADTKEVSQEVAKAFVEATLKQSELLGSWSLAVFGACIVLVAWYVQRRLDDDANRPRIRSLSVVFACGLLQGVSILLMYFAYGTMVSIIPELQFAQTQSANQFRSFLISIGFDEARYLFMFQFFSFFAGIVLLGVFAARNYNLVRR